MAISADMRAVKALLEDAGYSAANQVEGLRVWLEERDTATVHLVAFARPPFDMTTAAVVCEFTDQVAPSDRTLLAASALAAPAVLTAGHGQLSVWSPLIGAGSPLATGDGTESADVVRLLRPERLLAEKVGARQIPLFPTPVDMLQAARTDRATKLTPVLGASMAAASEYYEANENLREVAHKKAARLVVGALTTLVLRDKTDLRALTNEDLLLAVQQRFERNFDWLVGLRAPDRRLLFAVLSELGDWIDYSTLDPSILSEVYEGALVADEERASLGIHYTPPALARRLLAELPVETIPPEERNVLDPACGSGTLLVAAHERLRALQPDDWAEQHRHEDLRVHLRGVDIDPFASEIARLALLLNAMPAGNGWDIVNDDSLETADRFVGWPSIIVANPPYAHTRDGVVVERADAFVAAAVRAVRPGGLIALLLPQSWLDSAASADTRDHLRKACEVFEIWRLPLHTFPTSSARAVALIARARRGADVTDGGRLLRVVRPGIGLSTFTRSGETAETYVLPADNPERVGPLLPGPLQLACQPVELRLGDVAEVLAGPQPLATIEDGHGITPYLDTFRGLTPYARVEPSSLWRVSFPEDFQSARGSSLVPRRKVLVSAIRSSEGPWCAKSVLDNIGIAVRNSAHMVAPKSSDDEDALYALFAFTASGIFNCWIDEHAVGANIPTSATRSAPLPFGSQFVDRFGELGRRLSKPRSASDVQAVLREIEQVSLAGFATVPAVAAIVAKRLAGWSAPEGALRYDAVDLSPPPGDGSLRRFGYVMEVEPTRVRVWINGLTDDEGMWIENPTRMQGYLLRQDATFDVTDYAGGLTRARFHLQANSYQQPLPL